MRTFAQQPKTTQQTASAKSTIPGRAHFGQSRVVSTILQLQTTIGNHAVQRMLQADAQEPEAGMTGTATSRFGHDFSRIPIHASAANVIQTKLAINRPGDSYEQEADRVSEQITRTPEPRLQRKCACGGTPGHTGECEEYRKKRLSLQRESLDVAGPVADDFAPPIVHDVLRSPARSLDPETRAFMEPHFGHDFSRVRIHADAGASLAADAVQAQAFTVGSDIVMGSGKFTPSTPAGRKLLAHELTHVVQQTASRGAALRLQRAPDKEPKKVPAQEPKKEPSKEPKRVDVVLLGEGVTSGEELARVLAPGGKIIRVKSMGEAAAALSKIDVPHPGNATPAQVSPRATQRDSGRSDDGTPDDC